MPSSSFHRDPATAIITLGGQAQVVTFALDALLAAGEAISSVLVLHFSPPNPRVKRALSQLSAEFAGDRYGGRPVLYRHVPVAGNGAPLDYVCTEQDAETVWRLGRDLLADLKQQELRLHICIAGGPRMLALTLTSAALLQCDHLDRLWHLYTPRDVLEKVREGALLHAPPDAGIRLLPVPMAPLGSYFPALRQLARPGQAAASLLTPQDAARCHEVWRRLTARQREVLEALAAGQLPQEAADALHITLKTLDSHKTQILAECRVAWELADDEHLTYHFIRETFGLWLDCKRPA